MPHALVPSLDDRASSITVVRRSREVEYRRLYLGFLDHAPDDPPLVPTFDYILTSPTRRPSASVSAPVASTSGTARVGSGPPSRLTTAGRASRSSRTSAPPTCRTPQTSSRHAAKDTHGGVGPPLSQLREALATPGVGPSRPLLPR